MRHGRYGRRTRMQSLAVFLAAQATRLTATPSGSNFTAAIVHATSELEVAQQPDADDTLTVGSTVYTFVSSLTAAYDVLIGANVGATATNLTNAINNGSGEGTTYGTDTEANPDVTAAVDSAMVTLTAVTGGTPGNAVAVVCSNTDAISPPDATLTGGTSSNAMAATSHGLTAGEGPYRATTNGVLPGGLATGVDYWVNVLTANSFELQKSDGSGKRFTVPITRAGSGTQTITKPSSAVGMFELLRNRGAQVIKNASDIDAIN